MSTAHELIIPSHRWPAHSGPSLGSPSLQNALQRRMVGFRRTYGASEGRTLVVQPLTDEWVQDSADLLTDAFADSMGYISVYKNYLRRQIKKYLQSHVLLPPKSVVLVGLLLPAGAGGDDALGLEGLQQQEAPASSSSVSSDAGSSSSGMDSSSLSSSSTDPSSNLAQQGQQAVFQGAFAGDLPGPEPGSAMVVGAVEISFTEATRSRFMTLNSPPDRPYLCNMAVGREWQGQGHGTRLLEAAEALVADVGESIIYLHVRHQDKPAAALYAKAGYRPQAEDSILVRVVGLDRRYLLQKTISAPPGWKPPR